MSRTESIPRPSQPQFRALSPALRAAESDTSKYTPDGVLELRHWVRAVTLTSAAVAGLTLGACNKKTAEQNKVEATASTTTSSAKSGDKACCMGLNDCKGKGGCAVPESHACAGKNACKGQGGCNMHCPKK